MCEVRGRTGSLGCGKRATLPIDGRVATGFGEKPRSHSARGQESAVICCSTVPGRTKEKMKGVVVVAFRFEKLERRSLARLAVSCAAFSWLQSLFRRAHFLLGGLP